MRVLLPRIYLAASLLEMASNLLAYLGLSIHPFSFRSQFCFSGSLDFALVLSLWSFLQRSSKVSDPIISQLTFKLPVALHPRIHLCHPFQSSAGYHFLEKHHKSPCSLSIQTNMSKAETWFCQPEEGAGMDTPRVGQLAHRKNSSTAFIRNSLSNNFY